MSGLWVWQLVLEFLCLQEAKQTNKQTKSNAASASTQTFFNLIVELVHNNSNAQNHCQILVQAD